jgi:MerR family transcriptional regulator, heat shock protein HspR
MAGEYWTTGEVIKMFQVETRFLTLLEEEEIVCPDARGESCEKRFREADLERLRLAKLLVEEMGVNLAGVEIILRMRESMFEMRSQFDHILEDLAANLERVLQERNRRPQNTRL